MENNQPIYIVDTTMEGALLPDFLSERVYVGTSKEDAHSKTSTSILLMKVYVDNVSVAEKKKFPEMDEWSVVRNLVKDTEDQLSWIKSEEAKLEEKKESLQRNLRFKGLDVF